MSAKVLDSFQLGVRLITGTEWPIVYELRRVEMPDRRPEWEIVFGLCNGVPDRVETFRTLRAAQEVWDSLQREGRPSRAGEPTRARAIRFTDSEWEEVKERAKRAGLNASAYVRARALE